MKVITYNIRYILLFIDFTVSFFPPSQSNVDSSIVLDNKRTEERVTQRLY